MTNLSNFSIVAWALFVIVASIAWKNGYVCNRQVFVLLRIKYSLMAELRGFRKISESSFFGIPKDSGVSFYSCGKPEEILCFCCDSKISFQKMMKLLKSKLVKWGYTINVPRFTFADDKDAFIATKGKNSYRFALIMSENKNPHRKFMLNIKWIIRS